MKIVAVTGSGRDGNNLVLTEEIIKRLRKRAREEGLPFSAEIIKLRKVKLPFCISCHNCVTEKGEQYCPHKGEVGFLREKLEGADGIILGSPVSSLQVTGLMKSFIDHFSFYFHRPPLFQQRGLVITNTAGAGHIGAGKYLQTVLHAWGIPRPHRLSLQLQSLTVELDEKREKQLQKTADKFFQELVNKRDYRPSFIDVVYFSVWRAMASVGSPGEADYDYWRAKDWLDKRYYTQPVGVMKGSFGQLLFKFFRTHFAKNEEKGQL